jgi:hypothetical protein
MALDHKHLGYVGMPADCWSAGVILFVMLALVLPSILGARSSQTVDALSCLAGATPLTPINLPLLRNLASMIPFSLTLPRYQRYPARATSTSRNASSTGTYNSPPMFGMTCQKVCALLSTHFLRLVDAARIVTAKGLVSRLLIHGHLQRATVNQALQSRWITDNLEELESAYRKRIG